MEWIKIILPIVGVIIGWLLSESGKVFTDRRHDKRKLKKLLFFLLELRYRFERELSYEMDLDKYINLIKPKLAERLGVESNITDLTIGLDTWKPILKRIISKTKQDEEEFDYLNENIDKILIELAEIFPILAFELNGKHNIKDRLNKANNYAKEVEALSIDMPFDIRGLINPKLTKELLQDLNESIEMIAKKIDKKTLQLSKDKISIENSNEDEKKLSILMDQFLNELSESNLL